MYGVLGTHEGEDDEDRVSRNFPAIKLKTKPRRVIVP